MRKRRGLVTLIEAASLLSTGWLVWWASLIPRLHRATLADVLSQAVGFTLVAWACGAAVTYCLYMLLPLGERPERKANALRTAAVAVWFGPGLMLLSQFSAAALLAALVLVVYTSRLLYAPWLGSGEAATARALYVPREAGTFVDCQSRQPQVWRERLPAVAAAVCLEGGAAAVAMNYPLLGAGWWCLGTALLTVYSMATGAAGPGRPPSLPKSLLGVLATMVLAAALTLGGGRGAGQGIFPGLGSRTGGEKASLVEAARAALRRVFYGEQPGYTGAKGPAVPLPPAEVDTGAVGGFPGVILWPEIKPVPTLVAPMPALGTALFQGNSPRPLALPFAGEYWMYRVGFIRPPATSFRRRGSPTQLDFSTTDHSPLNMQAHHRLDAPIAVSCCGRIQLEVANGEVASGPVGLELVLVNNELPGRNFMSLGVAPVLSRPDQAGGRVRAVPETLTFAMPEPPSLDLFDELTIVFRSGRLRGGRSLHLAIERFILVPR